jgi:hypothetical protein
MKMLRHYFISDSLDELEVLEKRLEEGGVSRPQIHVLTSHEEELEQYDHLHRVQSFLKRDVVRSTVIGAVIGIVAAVCILSTAYLAGWTDSAAGWVPFIFLSIALLGFFTWEGGLLGIQKPNAHFARFERALKDGKHIFIVDLEPSQDGLLEKTLKQHPQVKLAGTEELRQRWIIEFEKKVPRFFKETFP